MDRTQQSCAGVCRSNLRKREEKFTYLIKKGKRVLRYITYGGEALGIPHGDGSVYVRLEKKGYVLEDLHQIHFGDLPEGSESISPAMAFTKEGESNGDYGSADTAVAGN